MADPKHKLGREEIMSFLLGELEEAETSRIEAMFLSDPTYSEALEEAKSQLYQEYKSGRLSPQQSGRFEARYLPDLDEDKKKFQAMLDRNEEGRLAGLPAAPEPAAPEPAVLKPAAAPLPRAPHVAPAPANSSQAPKIIAALILAVAIAGAVVFLRGKKDEPGQPSVALSVFSIRGKSQVLVLPKGANITLQLPIPASEASQSFAIIAYHGDTEASWVGETVGNTVETSVETTSLLDGRYDLELRGSDGSVIGYYSFRKQ